MNLATSNHLIQASECLRGLGEHHSATHGAVDAMHHAQKHIAWLVVAHLNHRLDVILQRLVCLAVGLNELAAALIDNYYMVVLVEYIFWMYHSLKFERKG